MSAFFAAVGGANHLRRINTTVSLALIGIFRHQSCDYVITHPKIDRRAT